MADHRAPPYYPSGPERGRSPPPPPHEPGYYPSGPERRMSPPPQHNYPSPDEKMHEPGYPALYHPHQQGYPDPHHPAVQQPVQQQPIPMTPMMQQQTNTTVVMMGQTQPQQKPLRAWSTGLFGCCEDPLSCVCVMFCPECYGCHLASKAGETCCLPSCVPGWLISLRAHTRGKHAIQGSICDDCCMVAFCYQCTMCQLAREIDNIQTGKAPQ